MISYAHEDAACRGCGLAMLAEGLESAKYVAEQAGLGLVDLDELLSAERSVLADYAPVPRTRGRPGGRGVQFEAT